MYMHGRVVVWRDWDISGGRVAFVMNDGAHCMNICVTRMSGLRLATCLAS